MNLEILLSCLYKHREAIARKLDAASRRQLIDYIREAVKTKTVSKEFFDFYGSDLYVSGERFFPGDEEEITPSNAETYGNEIIKALESFPERNEEEERDKDK